MITFWYPPHKAIWNIKESNSTVSSTMTFMQTIKESLKGCGVLFVVFEKAAKFSGCLLKLWFISNSNFIKHTILGT